MATTTRRRPRRAAAPSLPSLRPLLVPHSSRGRRPLTALACSSLFILLVLIIVTALLAALYDIARPLISSERASKVADVAITFGTYLVIAIVGISIVISRKVSVKGNVASIPKGYIPVAREDVVPPAFDLIQDEYDRSSLIVLLSTPKGRTQEGYGRPGGPYDGVHLRTGILSTISLLRNTISPSSSALPPARTSPLSPLAPLFSLSPPPSPSLALMAPLDQLYEQILVKATYAEDEPSEEEADQVMKITALFLDLLVDLKKRTMAEG